MLPVKPKETVSMVTRDGVRLDADLYRPEGKGPFPVLLMRQPYGRAIASTTDVGPTNSSTKVFQFSQAGHLPKYWGEATPHSLQTY